MKLKAEFRNGDILPLENSKTGGWIIERLIFTPDGCSALRKKTVSKKVVPSSQPFEQTVNFEWGDVFWSLTHSGEIVEGVVSSISSDDLGLCVNGLYPCEECFPTREAMVSGTFELIRQRRAEAAEMRRKDPLLYTIFGGAE